MERTELVLVCILVCIGMYGYVFGMYWHVFTFDSHSAAKVERTYGYVLWYVFVRIFLLICTNTYQYVRYILVHANTASDRAVRGPLCARQHARCFIWVLGVGLLQLATAARGYRCMYEPRKTANGHFHGLKGRRRLSVRNGMYRGMYSHVLTTYTYHDTN